MSNQDLINYQVSIEASNNASITQITQQNVFLNQNITQLQTQIANNNTQIATLQLDNEYIQATIGFIPNNE
jgi:cell division protein FtsB